MSTIITQHLFRVDLDSCPLEATLPRPLSHTDALADELILAVRRCMTPVPLSGMAVLASLTNANRQTLPLEGRIAGSSAIVPLPAECYAVPGPFRLTVQLRSGDVRHTLLHLTGEMARTSTDQLISSDDLLPTLPELLDEVADLHAATEAAQNAVTEADEALRRTDASVSAALASVSQALTEAAPGVICRSSGHAVIIGDAAARPAVQVTSGIAAAQSGSGHPAPDNVRPIVGRDMLTLTRTGKNLIDLAPFDSTASDTHYAPIRLNAGNYRLTLFGDDGTAAGALAGSAYTAGFADSTGAIIVLGVEGGTTMTAEQASRITQIAVSFDATQYAGSSAALHAQLETGLIATAYEPYQGQTMTAELPETVYGGSLDWTTGVLTVTHRRNAITRMSATHSNAGTGYLAASVTVSDMQSNCRDNGLCETMQPVVSHVGAISNCIVFGANNQTLYIAIDEALAGTTRDSLNTYLAEHPLIVVYPLAEPYTIRLTPRQLDLLKGSDCLWSDSGDTSVAYIADTRMYIDNAIAALAANQLNA